MGAAERKRKENPVKLSLSHKLLTAGLLSLGLGTLATPSLADPFPPPPALHKPVFQPPEFAGRPHHGMQVRLERINQRQDRQMQRILDGMENGRLTLREAVLLLREHQDIAYMERQYLADGRLDPFEFQTLDMRLDTASQNIRWEKQDGEQRGQWGYGQRR
jgi:hypothetical protein